MGKFEENFDILMCDECNVIRRMSGYFFVLNNNSLLFIHDRFQGFQIATIYVMSKLIYRF